MVINRGFKPTKLNRGFKPTELNRGFKTYVKYMRIKNLRY